MTQSRWQRFPVKANREALLFCFSNSLTFVVTAERPNINCPQSTYRTTVNSNLIAASLDKWVPALCRLSNVVVVGHQQQQI
jgi:hypothetical protein